MLFDCYFTISYPGRAFDCSCVNIVWWLRSFMGHTPLVHCDVHNVTVCRGIFVRYNRSIWIEILSHFNATVEFQFETVSSRTSVDLVGDGSGGENR
jgi:hypothetical protein